MLDKLAHKIEMQGILLTSVVNNQDTVFAGVIFSVALIGAAGELNVIIEKREARAKQKKAARIKMVKKKGWRRPSEW